MEEFKFVIRSLVLASLIIIVSQYQWNNETLESKAQTFFVESSTAEYLREAAAGGVKFIKESGQKSYAYINHKFFSKDKANRNPSLNKNAEPELYPDSVIEEY